jgi:hypothetical protein
VPESAPHAIVIDDDGDPCGVRLLAVAANDRHGAARFTGHGFGGRAEDLAGDPSDTDGTHTNHCRASRFVDQDTLRRSAFRVAFNLDRPAHGVQRGIGGAQRRLRVLDL